MEFENTKQYWMWYAHYLTEDIEDIGMKDILSTAVRSHMQSEAKRRDSFTNETLLLIESVVLEMFGITTGDKKGTILSVETKCEECGLDESYGIKVFYSDPARCMCHCGGMMLPVGFVHEKIKAIDLFA